MEYLMDLLNNQILVATAAAWFVAQLSKMIYEMVTGKFKTSRLTGGGGMPSSHSATVVGLATATGFAWGLDSFEFAMAFFFAFVVIYDARGVRLTTGKEARALNKINAERKAAGKDEILDEELDEMMGHTMPEIIAGVVIGIVVASIVSILYK